MSKTFIFTFLLFVFPKICSGEISNCDGVYSNKSCDEVGKSFNFSRTNSNSGNELDLPANQRSTRASLNSPSSSNLEENSEDKTSCQPIANGLDIRIENIDLVRNLSGNHKHTTVTGTVRNYSEAALLSPLKYIIKDSNGQIIEQKVLTNELTAGASNSFHASVNFAKLSDRDGHLYELSLSYAPAKRCDKKRIDTSSAFKSLGALNAGITAVDEPYRIRDEKRKSLQNLKDRIRQIKAANSSNFSRRQLEVHNINSSLNRICGTAYIYDKGFEDILSICRSLADEASKIQ